MKVHPVPRKRNIILRTPACGAQRKHLRRLPHIFAKVLELPFHSDADVAVEETHEFFRFTVLDTDVCEDVRAHTVQIHPGVTKIVVRSNDVVEGDYATSYMEMDVWRFRLPDSTRPELAMARCEEGDLVVVVPKEEYEREVWGEGNNLVLVQ